MPNKDEVFNDIIRKMDAAYDAYPDEAKELIDTAVEELKVYNETQLGEDKASMHIASTNLGSLDFAMIMHAMSLKMKINHLDFFSILGELFDFRDIDYLVAHLAVMRIPHKSSLSLQERYLLDLFRWVFIIVRSNSDSKHMALLEEEELLSKKSEDSHIVKNFSKAVN